MKRLSGPISKDSINNAINDSSVSSIYVNGINVKVGSVRLKTFATKGTNCVTCDAEGLAYYVEDNYSGPHLNLYALKNGVEVLMTKDHIHPKSKGGSDSLSNMQPMCETCNKLKSNLIISVNDMRKDLCLGEESKTRNSYVDEHFYYIEGGYSIQL